MVLGKPAGRAVEIYALEAGTGGFVIIGVSADDQSGRSVSSAGDVNGDALVVYVELDGQMGMIMKKPGELKNNDTPYTNRGGVLREGGGHPQSLYTPTRKTIG